MIRKQILGVLLLTVVGLHWSTPLRGQERDIHGNTHPQDVHGSTHPQDVHGSTHLQGVHGSTPIRVVGYGLYDYHYATDEVGGGALLLDWRVAPVFTLGVGVEYVSSNRISARLSGEAALLTTQKRQRLTLENSYLWRHYPAIDRQEFTSALQLGWRARHVDMHLGLCNRYSAALIQRTDGGAGTVFEPMNLMFAVEGWWNNQTLPQQWNVGLRWSNYNDFVIERVANWFFSAKGFYTLKNGTALTAEVGVHPAGSLNLTASYDGWFMHLGAMRNL